jgi:exopolyphosphatase/guanosine-5'-triphosphate,3'-diphosphate pyrophosphatase
MPQTALRPVRRPLAVRRRRGYARGRVRCACIDIGSNTTRLLVADVAGGALTPLLQARAFTHLGRACGPGEALPTATCDALAEVVCAQARDARAHGAGVLRVVATAAMRRAANGREACAALSAAVGVVVELLSAAEEARLAFAGATGGLGGLEATTPLAVVDVGGGSSQLVVGTRGGGVAWSASLALGSGDLVEAHLRCDPPTDAELDAVRAAVAAAVEGLAVPPVARVLAVGGSATSLRRLAGPRLDGERLEDALAALVAAPAAVVAARCEIDPERARLLPAGIVVLVALAARLGPLEIADGGLREGVLRELAAA